MSANVENWRFNPFTGDFNDVQIENELHTIAFDEHANVYGIRLRESIKLAGSLPFNLNSNYSIAEKETGAVFVEVPRSQIPDAGEFRVDYDAEGYYNTAFVEFNASENGKVVSVDYRGLGGTVAARSFNELVRDFLNNAVGGFLNSRVSIQNWNWEEIDSGFTQSIDIAYGNGTYVAIGQDASSIDEIWTSSDLSSWTSRFHPFTARMFCITYGNGIFVAAGSNGELATSPDGATWTPRTSGFGSSRIRAIHYDASAGLFAIGGANGKLATSPDGVTWTLRTSSFASTINDEITQIVSDGNGTWAAAGLSSSAGYVAKSTNGITWATASFPSGLNGGLFGSFGNGYWAFLTPSTATAHGGYRSTDLTNWEAIQVPYDPDVSGNHSDVAYDSDSGMWLVVVNGATDHSTPRLYQSLNDMASLNPLPTMLRTGSANRGGLIYIAVLKRWVILQRTHVGYSDKFEVSI